SMRLVLLLLFAAPLTAQTAAVPQWSRDAIWYQVFVERFRNGDAKNDPTVEDIRGFTRDPVPAGWATTPWGWDWYRMEPWAQASGRDFYHTVQFRRYGGDLQGVIDQLDYLQRLGVTALYLNPINDAPSLHKYDAASYHHIDRNFGPDPRGDVALMRRENPADPRTWRWTAADRLFLKLIDAVHRRGMRIIIDVSWNHTGTQFWAWQDVLRNQARSRYADWYAVEQFDDPATRDTNEFRYRGWANVPSLPEWKKFGRPEGKDHGPIPGTLHPEVIAHIEAVTRRWMDPNGDGDPRDGVDGFRLDVADVVPLDFWRHWRRVVRGINPDAYLVGEIWWEKWPDRMWDPAPWVQGDVFDAVMHYQWFTPSRSLFGATVPYLTPTQFRAAIDALGNGIPAANLDAMMNLTASHDTPRFSTAMANRGQNKYRATPREDSLYIVSRPRGSWVQQRLLLIHQFTMRGAPHVWNGDEVGMWGADDPDMRKPLVWGDLAYDDETTHPFGRARDRDVVRPDSITLGLYQELIALRRAHQRVLVDGRFEWLVTDDTTGLIAYRRVLGDTTIVVALNTRARPLAWPDGMRPSGTRLYATTDAGIGEGYGGEVWKVEGEGWRVEGGTRKAEGGEQNLPVPLAGEPRHIPVFRDGPVSILDVRLPPNDTSLYHVHDGATLYVPIVVQPADAQVLGRDWFGLTRASPNRFANVPFVLDTAYADAPLTHRVVNIGDSLYRLIVVMTDRRSAVPPATLGPPPFPGKAQHSGGWFRASVVAPGADSGWRFTPVPIVVVRQQPGRGSIERSDLGWQALDAPGDWAYVAPRSWWRVQGEEVVVIEVR
ncbi:MAG TPA: glycoside hydrolase family 13 protein, partial [Gemmatimonadales bacterium]|nr:glycoside hydrolase family 13 protein [Gemmatimonadales bacterium]